MRKAPALIAVGTLIAANLGCSLASISGGGAADVDATQIALQVSATLTAAAPTVAPTPSLVPTLAPLAPRLWMSYSGGGSDAWWLEGSVATQVSLAINIGQFYDYAPSTASILYASHFANQGAGPANLAVSDLWMADYPSGAAQAVIVTESIVEAFWNPDGQALAYILATPTRYELHWRTLDGDDRILATDLAPTWSISPAGDWIAFTRETGYESVGPPGLYVVPVAGGPEIKLSDADRHGSGSIGDRPDWSLDGTHIALSYSDPDAGRMGLIIAAADGSASADVIFAPGVALDIVTGGMPPSVLWHPDGRHLVGPGGAFYGMGGPQDVVLFELDPTLATIVSGTAFGKAGMVVDWSTPGSSVWILDELGNIVTLPLP
jgi:hypothetical protein